MLTTDQKGAIAETAIILEAIRRGVDCYRPAIEGTRYDLILDINGALLRVQCKWAAMQGGVVVVRCYSCRRAIEGMRVRRYNADEVDAIAAYSSDLDRCFLIPIDAIGDRRHFWLRVDPSRNNQLRGVNWASDFDFAATLSRLGAVAQLGERRAGSAKATGSSPVGST